MPTDPSIAAAMARSFMYRFLAQAYTDPTIAGWNSLCATASGEGLTAAMTAIFGNPPQHLSEPSSCTLSHTSSNSNPSFLSETLRTFSDQLRPESYDTFLNDYLAAFGHAARGRCPLNEIEYGDLKADPLFQPHRLADLAAFYRAFGLEISEEADERHDHIGVELEFMCVLTAKEAYALEHLSAGPEAEICREAQKKFLREHLGRWTPAFARRLAQAAGTGPLAALAHLTRCMIEWDCARLGFSPGSEDLLLRPVNEAAESLCSSCQLTQLPPGAFAAVDSSA